MGLIGDLFNKSNNIVMYTSNTCADCQAAKRFFSKHNIEIKYRDIAEKQNRDELEKKYGRMAVPTIIIGDKAILGFAENRAEIIKILNV